MCVLCVRYLRPDDLGPKELPVLKEEEEDEEEEEEEMETVVIAAPEEKWDCETIISELKFPSQKFHSDAQLLLHQLNLQEADWLIRQSAY